MFANFVSRWKPKPLTLAVILWGASLATGTLILNDYSYQAGRNATPSGGVLKQHSNATAQRYTLLMFAHPKCPCTRSSINELSRIQARCGNKLRTMVYFYQPADSGASWSMTDLWESAASIPGGQVFLDPSATTAKAYSATTSGQVLLYGLDDQLLFSGGITASRGHEGDNLGKSHIIKCVVDGHASAETFATPVFGCQIYSDHPAVGSQS